MCFQDLWRLLSQWREQPQPLQIPTLQTQKRDPRKMLLPGQPTKVSAKWIKFIFHYNLQHIFVSVCCHLWLGISLGPCGWAGLPAQICQWSLYESLRLGLAFLTTASHQVECWPREVIWAYRSHSYYSAWNKIVCPARICTNFRRVCSCCRLTSWTSGHTNNLLSSWKSNIDTMSSADTAVKIGGEGTAYSTVSPEVPPSDGELELDPYVGKGRHSIFLSQLSDKMNDPL